MSHCAPHRWYSGRMIRFDQDRVVICPLDARLRLIRWNREDVSQLGNQDEQMKVFRPDELTSMLEFWSGDSKVRTMAFRVVNTL